jgi:hypothetical protein
LHLQQGQDVHPAPSGHRQSPADFADGFFRAFLLFGSFILKEAVTAKSAQGVILRRACRRKMTN